MQIKEIVTINGIRNLKISFEKSNSDNYVFYTSTHDSELLSDDTFGSIIFINKTDLNQSLKIYKDYGEIHFLIDSGCENFVLNRNYEIDFIKKLQDRQKCIHLTKFPTGVVTYNDYVIGQEIPFYNKCVNILQACKQINNKKDVLDLYLKCLKIIRELYQNGIIYQDIHYGNFIVDEKTSDVHLVDFDASYTRFGNDEQTYNMMISNLKRMISTINEYINISISNLSSRNDLDEILEDIEDEYKKII